MELVNGTYQYKIRLGVEENLQVLREAVDVTLRLLHPFAPHMTEELWEVLGNTQPLMDLQLPTTDEEALIKDVVTIVLQVNGKLRGNLDVGVILQKDQIIELAQKEPKIIAHLEGKTLVKTIFVPGKLVNFVVK